MKFGCPRQLTDGRITDSHVSLSDRNMTDRLAFSAAQDESSWVENMWALFANGQQISRAFQTEKEAWHLARKSSLIGNGRLPKGFEIRQIRERTEAA
jgi:hypothetical protein